jgi:hypothetical protein
MAITPLFLFQIQLELAIALSKPCYCIIFLKIMEILNILF